MCVFSTVCYDCTSLVLVYIMNDVDVEAESIHVIPSLGQSGIAAA